MGKVKVWKNGGREDRFLERMFDQGKISKNIKPIALKRQFPLMFDEFSNNVIRNHLNEVKRRNGLYCIN